METNSPPPCPGTATVRRNPPRKARTTPYSGIPLPQPRSTKKKPISSFPLKDILSEEVPPNPNNVISDPPPSPLPSPSVSPPPLSENLKVYLRIRPANISKSSGNVKTVAESKNVWPKNPKPKATAKSKVNTATEICVQVNDDLRSVTVATPQTLQETKRSKSEIYEGFSGVFSSESSQSDVYEEMVKPLVDDFLQGKCGMLAAMGPSGSGKTHTVFGSTRDPGMVPLALRRIFGDIESTGILKSRLYYLSMLEISLERKGERLIDLLHDGGDVSMQQSVVKGLQEVMVSDAQQAESIVARGMLKRATATTNSNNQSSRSQCIISIRSASKNGDGENDDKASPMLSIVDLAGAEREKRTGNQGARLLESNFINNTSMVFGLCLRSLLEHQKNRNKPLQKHYQNSMLTKYMRDYLEGRKRMMLILTVKPGVEDYLNTSYLLRQAAPFTKIKFKNLEEPAKLPLNKRPNQSVPRVEQLKRMKMCNSEVSSEFCSPNVGTPSRKKVSEGSTGKEVISTKQDIVEEEIKGGDHVKIGEAKLTEIPVLCGEPVVLEGTNELPPQGNCAINNSDDHDDRKYRILLGISKALWNVLKQYKNELEALKSEKSHLEENLTIQKSINLELENELTDGKMRLQDLDSELNALKANFEVPSLCKNEKETDHSVRDVNPTTYLCSDDVKVHYSQEYEGLSESNNDAEDVKGSAETGMVIEHSTSQDLSVTANDDHLESNKQAQDDKGSIDIGMVVVHPRSEDQSVTTNEAQDLKVTSMCLDCETDAVESLEDSNILESESESLSDGPTNPAYLESQSVNNTSHSNSMPAQLQAVITDNKEFSSSDTHSDNLLDSMSDRSTHATYPESVSINDTSDSKDSDGRATHLQAVKTGDEDLDSSTTTHSDNMLGSSVSSQKDDMGLEMEEVQPYKGEDKGRLNQLVADLTTKASPILRQLHPQVIDPSNAKCVPNSQPEVPSSNAPNTGKPKRRLLPASSVMLRDISPVDLDDENTKPKGGRGKKPEMNKTEGSLSLLRLLKTRN